MSPRFAGSPLCERRHKVGYMPYVQDLTGPNPVITIRDCDGKGADDKQIGNLLRACERRSRVTVVLDSSGGSVHTALAGWSALKDFPGEVVTVVKKALSAASVIAMGGKKRLIEPNGRICIHPPHVVFEQGGQRSTEEVAAMHRDLAASTNVLAGIYSEASGGDFAYWLSEMREERSYNAQEAMQRGLVHAVIPAGQSGGIRNSADVGPPLNLTPELQLRCAIAGAVGAGVILAKRAQEQRARANGRPTWYHATGEPYR